MEEGEIVASYATGAVSGGEDFVGGLVGSIHKGEIIVSYATGAVSGGEDFVGGLVGLIDEGEIIASYATGVVSGEDAVGGLAGDMFIGEIVASYATGAVSGEDGVGGLAGLNTGEIVASYATGAVSGTSSVGGLVGVERDRYGTTTASYWDTLTSGHESSGGGTGKRTFELRTPTTYTGIYAAWNVDVDGDDTADAPWDFGTEDQYPTLRYGHSSASVSRQQSSQPEISTDSSLRDLLVGGATLSPDFSGSVTSYRAVADYAVVVVTATVANAGARAEISSTPDLGGYEPIENAGVRVETSPMDADSSVGGHQVWVGIGVASTVTVTVMAEDGSETEYVVAVGYEGVAPIFGVVATTLTYVAGGLVDKTLPVARGGNGELRYTLTDAGSTRTLTLPSGLKFDAASHRLYGRLTTASSSRYVLTVTDGDGDVSPDDAARMSIAIVVLPGHDGDRNGLIEVSSLEQLNAIRWDLDGDGVPTPAGAASYAAAFPNVGGVVCRTTTGGAACGGYELVTDLDFNTGASTRTDDLYYNGGAGWEPIGTLPNSGYAAVFRGNGHVIHNLFIHRPRELYVGLFGFVGPGSRIEGVGLRDVSVEGRGYVGGLAGQVGVRNRTGTPIIISSHVTGAVSGAYFTVGGLVGGMVGGEIVSSYAAGAVSGIYAVGGLVGRMLRGEIVSSYATGAVSRGRYISGLVGLMFGGEIVSSYATGAVSGAWHVGGLVGGMRGGGEIVSSYATGAVSGERNVGGLVGQRWSGTTIASYATGAVSGGRHVGGLVGWGDKGEIVASYATGAVSGTSSVGGLVGLNRYGTTTASYWDTLTSGHESSDGGTGKRTSELRSPTTYTGIYATWNVDVDGDDAADAPWDFGTENQYPILRYGHGSASVLRQRPSQPEVSTDSSLRNLLVDGATLSPDFSDSVTSYYAVADYAVVSVVATATDAGARVEISPRDADSGVGGHQVRLGAGTTNTVVVTVTAEDGSATEYVVVVGYDGVAPTFGVAATTLTYVAGGLVDETLPVARGGDGELSYRLTDAGGKTRTLMLPSGLKFDAASRRLYGRLTTASSSRYVLTATDDDGDVSPDDAARMSIAIVVLPNYDGDGDGLIEVTSLEQLNAIRWDLDGDGVPTTAGAVLYAAAFPNAGGAVVCRTTTSVVACEGYELVTDLDFNTGASTRTDDLYYNGGAGWEPIGTCDAVYAYGCNSFDPGYAAAFKGNGHVIHNLFIQRPREEYVGLFGFLNHGSRIEGVGLRDASVEGRNYVGGLAGQAGALNTSGTAIVSSYATGAVRGELYVGGLVGVNRGEIVASYTTGAARGKGDVGGLAGLNGGEIVASYATGAVSGVNAVGGLVGYHWGEIVASYATGAARGESFVGGLVGWNWNGTTTAGYWDTLTSGRESSAGGTGKRTFELRAPTTYTGIYAAWNVDVDGDDTADAPWDFGTEDQYPILRYGHSSASVSRQQSSQPEISTDGSLRDLLVGGTALSPDFSGLVKSYYAMADHMVVTVAATATDARARVEISPRDAESGVGGHQVRLGIGAVSTATMVTVTVTVTAADGSATEYVVMVGYEGVAPMFGVAATTLTYVAGGLVDETLPVAHGGNGKLSYTLTDAGSTRTLTLPSGLKFDAAARRLYGKPMTASSSRYVLTATDGDGDVSPADAARMSIAIVVTVGHDGDKDGLISITTLAQLNAIRWDLDGDGVSADARYAAAFPHAAMGMGCPSSGCTGYELDNDLDFDTDKNGIINADDGALSWGAGADAGKGWAPIGRSGYGFRATFMGNGHVVENLFIKRLSLGSVGLFGGVGAGGKIDGLGLIGAVVIGDFYVGGLVGYNNGEIIASYADAAVSGRDHAGGLVGRNKKRIVASYANATVSGGRSVGGLVGRNKGEIIASYANATVNGDRAVGGLVGRNKKRIIASYANATVNGRDYVGGLVGRGPGSIASYWDTDVSDLPSGARGKTTSELQTPTGYTGIYATWNMDLDNSTATGVGGKDDPWDFGTNRQYPVLQYGVLSTATQFAVQPFSDADLRSLILSAGVLAPNFDGKITSYAAIVGYTAIVGNEASYLTVTATAAQSSASVAFSSPDAQASVGGHQVRLEAGETDVITITVTAEDGISRKIYTVTVARPPEGVLEPGPYGAIARHMGIVRKAVPVVPVVEYALAQHATPTTVRARVFLQGAYDPASGRMRTTYRNLLPISQPYDSVAPSVDLGFALSEVTQTVVDWVVVELRATSQGIAAAVSSTRLDRRAALLLNDGSVVGVNPDAETAPATISSGNVIRFSYSPDSTTMADDYYVLIHHRNHLSVMTTATGGDSCSAADYCADFGNEQSWRDGQHDVGNSSYAMFAGDTDGDGDIDFDDGAAIRRFNLTAIISSQQYANDAVNGDLNFDGEVLSDDRYFILRNNAKRACNICSP